jgi:hypothetical protein
MNQVGDIGGMNLFNSIANVVADPITLKIASEVNHIAHDSENESTEQTLPTATIPSDVSVPTPPPSFSSLKSIDVSCTGLGVESIGALCVLLKKNGKNLVSIDLSCNKLGNAGTTLSVSNGPEGNASPLSANGVGAGRPSSGKGGDTDVVGKMLFESISQNKVFIKLMNELQFNSLEVYYAL